MKKAKTPEAYIASQEKWSAQLDQLRKILLSCELDETIKWGIPTYCIQNKNVVSIAGFKNFCVLWFYFGSALDDSKNNLQRAQEDTKHMRGWRFEEGENIPEQQVKSYILEAIEKVDVVDLTPQPKKIPMPELLQNTLEENQNLKTHFDTLTPFKQKEYQEYIATAKQIATKEKRLAKITPLILAGKGLNDKYR